MSKRKAPEDAEKQEALKKQRLLTVHVQPTDAHKETGPLVGPPPFRLSWPSRLKRI